ncbi:MAG: nucleotide exchange factor GrpE [Kiritimatiellae bacterium]|nr:nucleotide exchange factor GrpE [Kiritimatiellia bacterium]
MSFFKNSKDAETKQNPVKDGDAATAEAEAGTEKVTGSEPEEVAAEQRDAGEAGEGPTETGAEPSETEENPDPAEKKEEKPDELAVLKDRYARLMADFDNFRKRVAREYEETVKRSNARLLEELLPVLDDLELALTKAPSADDPMVSGVKMVTDKFVSVLERNGLKRIDARGEVFDPSVHEALSMLPSPDVPAQTVIDQFRCGWTLGGKLLRAAQVIVSSGAPEAAE